MKGDASSCAKNPDRLVKAVTILLEDNADVFTVAF